MLELPLERGEVDLNCLATRISLYFGVLLRVGMKKGGGRKCKAGERRGRKGAGYGRWTKEVMRKGRKGENLRKSSMTGRGTVPIKFRTLFA